MKKILVPTDFSKCALYATEVAASIARKNEARLIIMHIVNMPQYDSSGTTSSGRTAEEIFYAKLAQKNFKALLAQPFLKDVNVVELLQFSSVYETITYQAKEQGVDMIIMGSKGASGAEELFVGSVAEKVIRNSPVPVLTVKNKVEDFNPKSIVFASNFFGEAVGGFDGIKSFISMFSAKLHLVKVITPSHFENTMRSQKLIEDFAAETKLESFESAVYNHEDLDEGIIEYANSVGADLIAMETHGRKGLKHFFYGSVAETVANHTELPILSVRIKD